MLYFFYLLYTILHFREEERIVMIMRKCWEQYGTVLFLFVSEKNKNKKNPAYYN